MKAILSIKPEFVNKIVCGEKIFEYRKKVFKREIQSVVIYSTMPDGKLIGEFQIDEILEKSPEEIWSITSEQSGISRNFFMDYFHGREVAFAIKIKNLIIYPEPIDPFIHIVNFVAPQSFRYYDEQLII